MTTLRVLLIGHGRMGRLVESLAAEYGCEVAGVVDPASPAHAGPIDDERCRGVNVAIDFTHAEAVRSNLSALAARGVDIVLGTTGWQQHEAELRDVVQRAGVGIVAAPNFSTGVVLFEAIVAKAAAVFQGQAEFGAFIHETHHAMKKDAPSGTALLLERAMKTAGYTRSIDVAATRVGFVPGTHTVGFDGPSESITLTHAARDRSAFARGALTAARWIAGRKGWHTMHEVLGLEYRRMKNEE
jgi:4-hydroxy-tetrahydrodipicolinate reductase